MSGQIIDGNAVAHFLRRGMRERAEKLAVTGVRPGLAVILVGSDPASQVYVRNKIRACEECGVRSEKHLLSADVSEAEVLALIARLNADPRVHGILVQLPLPKQVDMRRVLEAINVDKDVDGFHLYNVGGLMVGGAVFPPCTPYGVQKLLEYTGIEVAGKNAVVVGASNIVGKPMAMMLLQQEATVSICHIRTRDLAQFTILADILIVAAGVPNLIVPQMVKRGAVVSDVDFEGVREKASWITPVPGGVGPMTVTMLIENTLKSAERAQGVTTG